MHEQKSADAEVRYGGFVKNSKMRSKEESKKRVDAVIRDSGSE
jgi:hypothetical protein